MVELTNDADKMICYIYQSFLQRRKDGSSKADARRFSADYFSTSKNFSSWHSQDISETLLELGRQQFVKIYIGGSFVLSDHGLVYMENRFKNNVKELAEFISHFIP